MKIVYTKSGGGADDDDNTDVDGTEGTDSDDDYGAAEEKDDNTRSDGKASAKSKAVGGFTDSGFRCKGTISLPSQYKASGRKLLCPVHGYDKVFKGKNAVIEHLNSVSIPQ